MAGDRVATAKPKLVRKAQAPGGRAPKAAALHAERATLHADIKASAGQPFDASLRGAMEQRGWARPAALPARYSKQDHVRLEAAADGQPRATIGSEQPDFSSVRLHSDGASQAAACRLRASAFTIGEHIYVDPARMPAGSQARHDLVAHEAAHVLQQRQAGRTMMQPRLIVTGSDADIQRFIDLAEPAMGETLSHDPVTNEITAIGSLAAPATSTAFGAAMHRIIDDPAQNAEAQIGAGQARIAGGGFPQPTDMTTSTVQTIDIDDMENLEAGVAGYGIAALAHELTENYEAHASVPAAGVDLFQDAHRRAKETESDVTEDTIGPGRRVAEAATPLVANVQTVAFDFENYYIVFDLTRNPANNDFSVSNNHTAQRVNVSTNTVDNFVTGSAAVPANDAAGTASATTIAAVAADVAANNLATVRIEGFTDDVGSKATNATLSADRARQASTALQAAGVRSGRIHTVGRGNASPVAANTSDANRTRNRRVVFIVDRPGP